MEFFRNLWTEEKAKKPIEPKRDVKKLPWEPASRGARTITAMRVQANQILRDEAEKRKKEG